MVREDGGPIRFRHALTRALVGVTLEWPGLILAPLTWAVSLCTMLARRAGRRLGDLAAGTIVIHDRTPAAWGWVPAHAPAAGRGGRPLLDLTGLDDELALAARHFLARSAEIRRAVPRAGSRYGLAEEVAAKIPQPPPPGTPPWLFLAAVLAERRRRAGQHVLTTRALTDRIWPGFGRLDQLRTVTPRSGGAERPAHAIAAMPSRPSPSRSVRAVRSQSASRLSPHAGRSP